MSANSDSQDEVVISDERLAQFESNAIKLKDLSAVERKALDILMQGEIADGEAPVGDEPAVKEAAEAASQIENKSSSKDQVPGTKYKEKADEANSYKQKVTSLTQKLADATAELEATRALSTLKVETPVKESDTLWTDKYQFDVAERLARIEALTLGGVKGAEEKFIKLTKELAEQKTFAEVNAFASSNPELKLSRPFEDANAEYVAFTQKLGATPTDLSVVDKYFEDANFRKEMESKGIKAPKDYDRLAVILQIYHRKSSMGYPNFDDAYLGHLRETKQLDKRFNGTYLKGVEDAVNKIANNKNETTILDPGNSNESAFSMSEAQMEAWLVKNPRPATSSQKAVMLQIQAHLQARSKG